MGFTLRVKGLLLFQQGQWISTVHLPEHPARSVYTTLRWPCDHLPLHWQRLQQDSVWLGCSIPHTFAWVDHALSQLPSSTPWRVRITMTDSLTVQAVPLPDDTSAGLTTTAISFRYQRPHPLIKHGDLNACHAMARFASHAGFTDVVLVNDRGELSEGAFAALAVWSGAEWWFPHPLLQGVLPSITAQRFQYWLSQSGPPWYYQAVKPNQLQGKGLVLLSAIRGITPVDRFDGLALASIPLAVYPQGQLY